MNLNEFLDQMHEAEKNEAVSRCGVMPDPTELNKLKMRDKAPFAKPDRKKILGSLEIRRDITVEALVRDVAEYVASQDRSIVIYLEPGEYTREGILKSAALSLVSIYSSLILKLSQDPSGMMHVGLADEVDKIIKFKSVLEQDPNDKYVINSQEGEKLKDELSESIIDVATFIHELENPKPTGQYL